MELGISAAASTEKAKNPMARASNGLRRAKSVLTAIATVTVALFQMSP